MTDREKIIKAIENAKKQSVEYAQDYILVPLRETDMILTLLKEQEPVKPYAQGDGSFACDNCGETVGWEELNCGGFSMVKYKYCPECGRKVKWNAD